MARFHNVTTKSNRATSNRQDGHINMRIVIFETSDKTMNAMHIRHWRWLVGYTSILTAPVGIHKSFGCTPENPMITGVHPTSLKCTQIIQAHTTSPGYTPSCRCPHQITRVHQANRYILLGYQDPSH